MAPTPKPQPGDMIEISRHGVYAHWTVYVGDGYVVHFGVPAADKVTISKVVFSQTVTGRVAKEKLEDVAGNDKWSVKNSLDGRLKPRPAQDIVKDACAQVGKERQYNLRNSNCEHFANELRYGVALSHQVQKVEEAGAAAARAEAARAEAEAAAAEAEAAAGFGIFGSLVIGPGAFAKSAVKPAQTNWNLKKF